TQARVMLLAVLDLTRNKHGAAPLGLGGLGRSLRPAALLLASATATATTATTLGTLTTLPATGSALRGLLGLTLGTGVRGLAVVDPYVVEVAAVRGTCLEEAVVDVAAKLVQRDPSLAVALRAGHLCTTLPATTLDPE